MLYNCINVVLKNNFIFMRDRAKEEFRKFGRLILKIIIVLSAVLGILTLTGANETARRYVAGALIILIALLGISGSMDLGTGSNVAHHESGRNLVEVVRVIDGDTIVVEGNKEVRLIGINSPESGECFFEESKDALVDLVEGKEVELKRDISGMDDFGRLLRYVFLPSDSEYTDDIFVNRELLKGGYADIRPLSQDRKYRRLLTSSRNQALTKHNGMWGACKNREQKAESFYPLEINDRPTDPKCLIKGNISDHGLGKNYFPVGCSNYGNVKIDFSHGEKYFCTEQEAIKAGFVKSRSCH